MNQDLLWTRRGMLQASAAGWLASAWPGSLDVQLLAQNQGERPHQADEVTVVNPRGRVPVSLIIDDSTCLANLAHFAIPQFAEVFPDRYRQDWSKLPREIPDAFVRKFGEWCREHGIKGKYSLIPYPACIGRVDQGLPDWSQKQLEESLKLVREFMMVNWDIHPEMVTHTWAINTKTGKPFPEKTEQFMENWGFSVGKSAEQLAEYMAYALRILKNVGLRCEGVTTPGGFGNRSREALARGTLLAVRDIFQAEIPHYFRHHFTGKESVAPRVEEASGLDTDDPRCVVSIVGCTGDWFGGWDGLTPGSVDQFITEDLEGGRLPEIIDRGEPAIMVSHWPGLYFNGDEVGFAILQDVVRRLHRRDDDLIWMKLSEIARYWAAKTLTRIELKRETITLHGPFACSDFTFEVTAPHARILKATAAGKPMALKEIDQPLDLTAGQWVRDDDDVRVCLNLPKRETVTLTWSS
ncbi:MAG TPA: hypothetical protein VK137_17355 [Planctomycetaceae bacterium]|nr:hypothetical protein [Planctomycetaceae bacterium]